MKTYNKKIKKVKWLLDILLLDETAFHYSGCDDMNLITPVQRKLLDSLNTTQAALGKAMVELKQASSTKSNWNRMRMPGDPPDPKSIARR